MSSFSRHDRDKRALAGCVIRLIRQARRTMVVEPRQRREDARQIWMLRWMPEIRIVSKDAVRRRLRAASDTLCR